MKSLKDMPEANGVDVRCELISFYNKYYVSDAMTLVLLSKHDLDTMQQWVKQYFSPIRSVSSSCCPPPGTNHTSTATLSPCNTFIHTLHIGCLH